MVVDNIKENIHRILNKEKIKADKRVVIYLFFVVLSTIFWFLNQLDKEYETEITLPVRYTDFPADKILVNELPDQFSLRVKSHGYRLLEYKISNKFLPFSINVNSLTLRFNSRSKDDNQLYALTRNLTVDVKRWLDSEIDILEITPDSLYFNFAERVFKKVPVTSNLNINPATQYMVRGEIKFGPDSITISGAEPIVDTIDKVYTKAKELFDLNSTYQDEIKLQKITSVDFSDDEVDVRVEIEKFTEGTMKLKLKQINVPDSVTLKTFPNNILVMYFVALSDYEKVLPQLFEATVDYKDIKNFENELPVRIINKPEYINTVRFSPQTVEYIIEKK